VTIENTSALSVEHEVEREEREESRGEVDMLVEPDNPE
jgi:hypothetical protein